LNWANPGTQRPWICQDAALPVAEQVRRRVLAVRAFHAARPTDVTRYHRRGIEPLTYAEWCELVNECFLSRVTGTPLTAAVTRARDVQFDLIRDGRVYFCCDKNLLEQHDGYTLLFGSLSLLVVAIQIDNKYGTAFKDALRQRGEPVVFTCDIPMAMIEDNALAQLVAKLSESKTAVLDFHFSIPHALPAQFITSHYRPDRVVDAVYGRHIGATSQVAPA
jgi:hypothetical protein